MPPALKKNIPPPLGTVQTQSYRIRWEQSNYVSRPHVIAMVGLPARGKTYMSRKLSRYLNWIGISTKVFNLGEFRRHTTNTCKNHEFFAQDNKEAAAIRTQCAVDALDNICTWLEASGEVAVLDGTNSTMERRKLIREIVVNKMGYKLFFIESVCDDLKIIETNIMKVKVSSPDYIGKDKEFVFQDFLQRIEHYQDQYETLEENDESDLSFIKIYNTGEKVIVHKHEGSLQSKVIYYLMNINIRPRVIYLTRHGESCHNLDGRLGGDSDLSYRGQQYATALANYIKQENVSDLRVWTSLLKRTLQTAAYISTMQERWKALNEIDAGICEEMTYEEIQERYPEEFAKRDRSKFKYRYPRGESYEDVVIRLETVVIELERQGNVLVVSHQAVVRCLLAYFLGKSEEELPYIQVPLHTVIKLTADGYGFRMECITLSTDPKFGEKNKESPNDLSLSLIV